MGSCIKRTDTAIAGKRIGERIAVFMVVIKPLKELRRSNLSLLVILSK